MRVAISFSGLPRLYPISVASWSRVIEKYKADTYFHMWDDNTISMAELTHQLTWAFRPIIINIESLPTIDTSLYPDRHWPCIDVYRSLSMWHGINRSYRLIKDSYREYDIVIRARLDWYVENLELKQEENIIIPWDNDKIPLKFTYRDEVVHGVNDHMAYGPMSYMEKYANTLNEIYPLYAEELVDYCPENFLFASIIKQNIPYSFQELHHKLIRG